MSGRLRTNVRKLARRNTNHFVLQAEKRHVASYLGTTPENLSRGPKALEREGVKLKGQTVTITDRARLLAACPPDILIGGPGPETSSGGISLPGLALLAGK